MSVVQEKQVGSGAPYFTSYYLDPRKHQSNKRLNTINDYYLFFDAKIVINPVPVSSTPPDRFRPFACIIYIAGAAAYNALHAQQPCVRFVRNGSQPNEKDPAA